MIEFTEFPKIARLNRECIVTEKIDGTNAQVYTTLRDHVDTDPTILASIDDEDSAIPGVGWEIRAGSRNRWLTRETDNFGFAKWVSENANDLLQLGEGRHFGEWWGSGIQRGYGLPKGEKRFSLFNVSRWAPHGTEPQRITTADPRIEKYQEVLPPCVGLVPVLYRGPFDTARIAATLTHLSATSSVASPGFMKPEGIVVFHTAANSGFKVTLEKDEVPKGLVR